jgi:ribosomal protein S18 acetylase RimI-like enzyme
MDIVVIKKEKDESALKKFMDIEWKKWDLEHYGEPVNFITEEFSLKAIEGEEIVGALIFKVDGEVAFIDELIVKFDRTGEGIGEELIVKAESIAREYNCHKIQLHTGVDWKARKFYERMGYKKTNDLPDQYLRRDFVEYTKYLI